MYTQQLQAHNIKHVKPEISIIMPAYNEEENIEKIIERTEKTLKEITENYELIIVDDGSKDNTYKKALQIASKNEKIKIIKNRTNIGKGYAIKHASKYVTGKIVIIIDSDMEIDPEQIKQYIKILKKYDICIASKRHPKSIYKAPIIRKILSITFNKLVRLMTGIKLADTQTGLKAIKTEPFKKIMNIILVKRYAYDVEMLAIAQLLKLKIAELPVKIEQKSKFSIKAVMYMLIDLLGITYRLRIIKWYQKNLEKQNPKYKPIIPL